MYDGPLLPKISLGRCEIIFRKIYGNGKISYFTAMRSIILMSLNGKNRKIYQNTAKFFDEYFNK